MICPFCKNEMLLGFIPTNSIDWIPMDGSAKLKYNNDKKYGFRIGAHNFFNYKKQPAEYCPQCDKIIIDSSDS